LIFVGLLLRGLARFTLRLLFVALVAATLLKVLSFGVALYAEHHPRQVERLAGRLFGMPVQVAAIETRWRGFTPRIWLRDLSVGKGKERLHLGNVLAAVSLGALPRFRQTLPVSLYLQGTRLRVVRDEQGITRIVGLPAGQGGRFTPPALLRIENATVIWEDRKRDATVVERHLDLQLRARGEVRELLVTSRNLDLRLRGEIRGRLSGTRWSARFWLRCRGLEPASLLAPYLPRGMRIGSARMDLEAWSRWENGSHRATRLLFQLADIQAARPQAPPFHLEKIAGDLLFKATQTGWLLQLAGGALQAEGAPPLQGVELAMRSDGENRLLGVSKLELAALTPLVPWLPLPPAQAEMVSAIAPTGKVEGLRLFLQRKEGTVDWRARARLAGLRVHPWKSVPGVRGLQAELMADPSGVVLQLHSEETAVEMPRLFRQPIELERLEGTLTWRHTEKGWRLDAPALVAENADLATRTRLHLSKEEKAPLFADIQTDFRDGDGAHAPRYYPVGIMKPKLVKWLDEAILFGRVPQGSFILHGPLTSFPFHERHDGHFEVLFRAEDIALAYHKEWPTLQGAEGWVRFHDNSLEIEVGHARLYKSEIHDAVARIRSLKPLAPLEISGVAQGPLADQLRLLRETPLKKRLARRIEGIELGGRGRLQATLRIPFRRYDYRFDGTLSFRDARFSWAPQRLVVDRLTGRLKIDNDGIRGQGVTGRAFGEPVILDVAPDDGSTRITARGRIPAQALGRHYPLLTALHADGAAVMKLELELPNHGKGEKAPVTLQLRSDLQGLSLDLPPPLGKSAKEARETVIGMRLGGTENRFTLRMGKRFGLTATLAPDRSLKLLAAFSRLPLQPWLRWLQELPERSMKGGSKITSVMLKTDRLEAYPLPAGPLKLEARRTQGGWRGTLDGEAAAGAVELVEEKGRQRLKLDLDRLRLETLQKAASKETADSPIDPRRVALIDLHSRRFRLNQADLGELRIRSTPLPEGQKVETLSLRGGIARLEAQGRWTRAEGRQETHLSGTLNTDDMGRFLRDGLRMDFLAGSKAYFSFDLGWRGAPFRFGLGRLEGRLQLDMTAGRFLNIKPGAARILGLLNFGALGRRLKLDFKDLYKQGLAFDTILGTFRLERGKLYTNDLEINAPSSLIRIAGSTDLVARTHDQVVTVSPRLDATLPVAGALAGGPVGGLVALLAQQAFSGKLERLQRRYYSVTGSWDDPQVAPLKKEPKAP